MKLPAGIKSILIFRALQLGDMLCAIPAIRALRYKYPDAVITLAGMPWQASFTERFDEFIDEFIWFPGYPGLPEQPFDAAGFSSFLINIQQKKFDLAIQLQGNGTIVNSMMMLFGAKITAGYFKKGDYQPNDEYFLEYPDHGPEPDRHLLLMDFLGIPTQGNGLIFPLTEKDEADHRLLDVPVLYKKYVCIHPGSRGTWRQWPTTHFAALADHCAESGFKIVVTGTQQEVDIADEVISHMKHPAINMAGKTNLGAMGVLINNAYALVSNCTGVSHMAAAFKTQSVVISMDGEPERWGPVNKKLHITINWLTDPDLEIVIHKTTALLTN